MIQILDDGTVIPSVLSMMPMGEYEDLGHQNNLALRQGEVKEIIYPDSPRSVTKKYLEYRVAVQQKDGSGTGATVEYGNCIIVNMFGGVADRFRFTLRPDSTTQASKSKPSGDGSKVHVLCVDGQSTRAFIIGGIREDDDKDLKADGHNLLWQFNGMKAAINKDGEFMMEFGGPTKADATLADGAEASDSGGKISWLKNGDIVIEHANQKAILEHQNKNWRIEADNDIKTKSGATTTFTAKNVKVGGDSASEHLVLGDTWRQKEQSRHQAIMQSIGTIVGACTSLATALGTASGSLSTAAIAHLTPVTGAIAGSPAVAAAAVALGTCAGFLGTIITQLGSITQAIGQYEAGKYLSSKNTTDG